ncbi:MAG: DNA adenine methylase [Verrucomicrobia bacterium]|nr:DNA adenine methylase [Verrucomicrobiota bacterium]
MPALRYYGGKFRLGRKICHLFPDHECYVEPFGGAAGVLMRNDPSPIELYNDLDRRVVNFFRVLRENPRDLIRAVERTPFSREEFDAAFHPSEAPVEDARRYFVLAWQSFGGPRTNKKTGWKCQKRVWENSRAHHMDEYRSAARNLVAVARRLRTVQIECDDAFRVIARYDSPRALFYVDPPYPADTRNESWCRSAYNFEFSSMQHELLAAALKRCKGAVVVSSYPNAQYDQLFSEWEKVEFYIQTMNGSIATEVLWLKARAE